MPRPFNRVRVEVETVAADNSFGAGATDPFVVEGSRKKRRREAGNIATTTKSQGGTLTRPICLESSSLVGDVGPFVVVVAGLPKLQWPPCLF